MKLYGSLPSPYSRKAYVVALELGLRLALEYIDVRADESDYGAINPIHRIPALLLDDGQVLPDSRLICEYLDTLVRGGLLPTAGPARWAVLKLQALGDGIMDAAVPRLNEIRRPPEQQSPRRLAQYRRSVRQIVDALEADAGGLEGGLNLGIISVGCALGYLDFRFASENWREGHPRLAAWYAEFSQRPSMVETRPAG